MDYAQQFEALPKTPQDFHTSSLQVAMMFADTGENPQAVDFAYNKLKKGTHGVELAERYLEKAYHYTLSKPAIMFIVMLCSGNAGRIVAYLDYLQYKATPGQHLTMLTITHLFKMGYPDVPALLHLLDSLKKQNK